jgi:putative spermidine/putrescine transport system ATP-binding protein
MSEGRVEQVGTPAAIYGAPATAFVARFVGQLNVLTGSVMDGRAGIMSVGGQTITLGAPLSGAVGSEVSLAIRPEAIELGTGDDAAQRLVGLVEDIQFLGPVIRVRMRLDGEGGTLLFDTFNRPGTVAPELGHTVTVSFPGASAMVLDATAAAVAASEPDIEETP